MARWVIVALLWSAVGADEYGGASMPQYAAGGGGADYAAAPLVAAVAALEDYRGHSADAPASLDYKYEEEPQGITDKPTKNNIESDTWKKPAKKHRGLRFNREEPPDGEMDSGAEPLPKLKSSRRRYPRHRLRLKSKSRDEEEPARQRRGRYGRSRHEDFLRSDNLDKADYRDDNRKLPDEDIDTFTRRETTDRVIRRKARDRKFVNPPTVSDETESEVEVIPDRKLKYDKSTEYEDESPRRRGRPSSTESRYRPGPEEDQDQEERRSRPRERPPPKHYADYDDYYDMRRVNDIKNKLPMLLRRTTTRAAVLSTKSDLLAMLLTARRGGGGSLLVVPTRSTQLTEPTDTTTTTTTTSTTTSQTTTTSKSTSELSIAEKSRLSILKKIQKKDKVRGEPTRKPPVLLHVTNKMATVVLIEPPTSANPWLRARLVSDDSPIKLEKVKRLMRQKVVAGAKSIQDLTDNWDEMVCDYIDVSLLDSAGHHVPKLMTLAIVFAVHGFLALLNKLLLV